MSLQIATSGVSDLTSISVELTVLVRSMFCRDTGVDVLLFARMLHGLRDPLVAASLTLPWAFPSPRWMSFTLSLFHPMLAWTDPSFRPRFFSILLHRCPMPPTRNLS